MCAFGIGNGTHSTLLIYANICSEALFNLFRVILFIIIASKPATLWWWKSTTRQRVDVLLTVQPKVVVPPTLGYKEIIPQADAACKVVYDDTPTWLYKLD